MPVNDTTTNRGYQKPNIANTLADDVGRLRSALDSIDTDMASKAPTAGPTFTGVVAIAGGSAAAPSLAFTGDTNTGLYSPGTDQVAISTGGTGRLFVAADGRVAIGASSVSSNSFEITDTNASLRFRASSSGSYTSQGIFFQVDSSAQAHIYNDGPGNIVFRNTSSLTERMRLDSSGRLLVGTSSARANAFAGGVTPQVQMEGTTGATSSLLLASNRNDIGQAFLVFGKSRSTSVGGNTSVASGDILGTITFQGADGTNLIEGARIESYVDGTPGTNDMPGRLVFSTTADGASTPSERMRIDSTGYVAIGRNSALARLHLGGETAQYPASLRIEPTAHATSRRAAIAFGADWLILQDTNGDGNINFAIYNSASNRSFLVISTGGTTTLASNAATPPFIASIGGSEVARIDSSGRLLVGTSTAFGTGVVQVTAGSYNLGTYTANASSSTFVFIKSRSTTPGQFTIVQSGDELGGITFQGTDGSAAVSGASIFAAVDGTPGTNSMPGRIVLSTTASGASSPTEQWRINNAGTVIYNQPAPAAVNTTATLTVANLTAKIITSTTAAAVTMTLPTGTDMDAGFSGLYTNMAFEWYVINTGGTNAVTVAANTAHTIVGSGTVSANNSGKFLSRRTAATTWVTYHLSS